MITIDMGSNDLAVAGCIVGNDVNVPCILTAANQAATNLTGTDGQILAIQSVALSDVLNNDVLGVVYELFDIPVADVAGAFQSSNFDIAPAPFPPIPMNVLRICQWTYMCAPAPAGPNTHANSTGYGVIAATIAATLP